MQKFFKGMMWIALMPLLQNCGSSYESSAPLLDTPSEESQENTIQMASLDFCDDLLSTETGSLCAIQPSKTDPLIQDFARGVSTTPGPGFGFHVVGVPQDAQNIKGVWLHFGGSFGSPYQPKDGKFNAKTWMSEVLSQNYLVIGIAYNNEKSVNGDLCGAQTSGARIDNCAGLVREEILTGVDKTSLVDVNLQNSVSYRLGRLIAYLQQKGFSFPSEFQPETLDWTRIRVSGHSQGAGHAYYIAKNMGVKSACLLGGPYDTPDSIGLSPGASIADWYLKPEVKTPLSQIGAFVVTSDPSYNYFVSAYDLIGLVKNQDWFEVSGNYVNTEGEPLDGHAASVGAPALAMQRAQACFSL